MRQKEFKIEDKNSIQTLIDNTNHCVLSLSSKDCIPYSVPVNYIRIEEDIYFHSSKRGKKIDIIKSNNKLSISIIKELSIIPSYASGAEIACPASQFFLSVQIDGEAFFINDIIDKVKIFKDLMAKYQPEGNFKGFDMNNEDYNKNLNQVEIVKIKALNTSAKFKLGQHLSDDTFNLILDYLKNKNDSLCLLTIDLMQKYRSK